MKGSYVVVLLTGGVVLAGALWFALQRPASGAALGQEIYTTGQDPRKSISYQIPGPGMMMGQGMMAQLSCADCHGQNGTGGMPFPNGVTSANLAVLTQTNQDPPYTFALFQRALTKGIDNQGKPLQTPMPHWSMSQQDMRALWAYVKTLQK